MTVDAAAAGAAATAAATADAQALAATSKAFYDLLAAFGLRTRRNAQAVWASLDANHLTASWGSQARDQLLVEVATAQLGAATAADRYVAAAVEAQGAVGQTGLVIPDAFAAVASDGGVLDDLLMQPMIQTIARLDAGVPTDQAMASGAATLDMIVGTQIADTGREATRTAMTATRSVTGYVRMLTPPSCGRCAVLAGRTYRYSTGFLRHPQCFPAGTVVSGPAVDAATRRWFEGEVVILRTAGGKELTATGNHPVLTDCGWVPANLLREGDHVVSRARGERATALVVPHEDQMPARIEDVWRAGIVGPLQRVPTTAEDFHGDGCHGEVDVVLADRLLRNRPETSRDEVAVHQGLAGGFVAALGLLRDGALDKALVGVGNAAYSGMGRRGLGVALLGGHLASPDESSGRAAPDRYPGALKTAPDHVAADAEALAQAVFALSGLVGGHKRTGIQFEVAPRWDAPAVPFSVENRGAYASVGDDLRERLAGQVTLDGVVESRRVQWSGHVYNLTSSEGWFDANGIVVSNCDCIMVPAAEDVADDLRTDPKAYFDSLSAADQNRYFGAGNAEALRLGGDMSRVVNSSRGSRSKAAGLSTPGRRKGGKPTPGSLIAQADGNRSEAIRLLTQHGFITA